MKLLSTRLLPIPALLRRGFAGAATLLPGLALANPTGGQVIDGKVTISTPSSNGMVVNEGTNSAIVNWQTFSIGGNEYVQFIQPSSSSVILNRVVGNSPSSIFGNLSANGRVFLINPDGVLFAPGSSVDVGALVASTVNISDADFKAGHYIFSGATSGAGITNQGTITAHNGGFVVLNGDYVHNSGVIQARLGEVALASGSQMTLSMDQHGLIGYTVDKAALSSKAGVTNSGQLLADGGRVIMTAEVAHNLVSTAVNNSGLIRAQGISEHDGDIELTASGGGIVDSGTLDASSTTGNGGNLQLHSDYDIDLQSSARLLASGENQGGTIDAIAGGSFHLRKGGLIEAVATAAKGVGGVSELSAHKKFGLAGEVNLGHGGKLMIDPADVTIHDGAATTTNTSTSDYYEQSLETTLAGGAGVSILATNSITLNSLTDGSLDGRGTGSNVGKGGALSLQIQGAGGTIQFLNTSNTIKVDDTLMLDAGSSTGIINVGNLQAGQIALHGLTSVTTGSLKSSLGSISISGGTVTTGSIDVTNAQLTESKLAINATGNVTVNGGITVSGGGGSGTFDTSAGSVQASAQITTTQNVHVTGNIAVTGLAYTRASSGASFSSVDSEGDGQLSLQGSQITLAGVTVNGVGGASFTATASQSINIGSAVNVTASRATIRRTGGSNSINLSGNASIKLAASNSSSAAGLTITTNGLTATGPNAGVLVSGGTLNLKNGSSGKAIVATALTGGTSTGGSGNFYQHSYGGSSAQAVATDYGAAAVVINRAGTGTTTIGGIAISGPAAALQLQGSGGVTTVNGSISVQASGYTVTGFASQVPAFRRLTAPLLGLGSPAGLLQPPVILDGTTHWGTARFTAGGSSGATGDLLTITGGVTVSGLGEADAKISATGLSIGGALSVTAAKGSLQGVSTSSYFNASTSSFGTVTRTISNSAGTGAATIGQANVSVFTGNNTHDVSIGSLTVRGLSAQASFNGGRNFSITGGVTIDGQFGGAAPDYMEVATLVPANGPSFTGTTDWVGDNNFLRIGGSSNPITSVTLGDVSVSGYGFVGLDVRGGSVSMGNVTLTQSAGLFTSTDKTRYSTSYSVNNPGTAIQLAASSGPVTATSLTVTSAGAVAQSLSASFTNAYSITAPSYSSVVSGVVSLTNPLLTPYPASSTEVTTVPGNSTLVGVTVAANDISLNISTNLALTTQSLVASHDLTIQTGGNLTLSSNSLIGGNSLSLTAGGNFSDTNSTLASPAVTVSAAGSLNLNGTTITGAASGSRGAISLSAQTIGLASGQILRGTNVSLDVTGGDLNLTNNVVDASSALTLTASGSISADNSVLLGDTTTITAPNGITITDSTVGGSGGTTASSSITMTASNGVITGANSTIVEGVDVTLTGLGFVSNSSGGITPTISATNLTLDATGGDLDITPSVALIVSNDMLLESQTGSVKISETLNAGGNITIQASNGLVTTQDINAGNALDIAASGTVTTGNIAVGLGSTSQALSITGSAITTGNITNNTPTGTIGNGNDMTLTATAGSITTGNIVTSASGSTTAFLAATATGGGIKMGNISVEGVSLASSGNMALGALSLQSPTPPQSTITSSGGTVSLASLSGNAPVTISGAGNVSISGNTTTTGAVSITSKTGSIQTGDIAGASSIDLAAGNAITTGNDSASGGITLTAANTITAGNENAGGAVSITSKSGSIQTGDITGASSIDLAAGSSITTGSDSATGNITLTAGTGITLANDALVAGGLLSLTAATGDISATNAALSGSTLVMNATTGSIVLNNSLLSADTIGAVAGTNINITHSSLGGIVGSNGTTPASLIALSANGGDLTLDDATALTGDAIGLFATGSVTSTNTSGATVINAGALSVQAFDTIDLSQATLEIGTGTAQFGSDPTLLQQIAQMSGGHIVLPASGPNASFKAKVVNLGTISTQNQGADLYLYIESQATTSGLGYSIAKITGAGNALLDYNLYGGDVQVVNLPAGTRPLFGSFATTAPTPLTINGSVNAPSGLTTLIIGSSLYAGDITVNPGTVFTPNDPASVNLVFATTGDVSGAGNLHTTGYVLVLNQIITNPVAQLPITPGDYTPPPTGDLGSPQPAPEDPDDPGVNEANEGTIVQQTSSQGVLSSSCSGT